MHTQWVITELEGLLVKIDQVAYVPHLEAPTDRPYPFAYSITISNNSQTPVTIKARKWIVTETTGERIVVEGDGVVGKFPYLKPGDQFSYSSYHVIAKEGIAEGSYFGVTDDGKHVFTSIPAFRMTAPDRV